MLVVEDDGDSCSALIEMMALEGIPAVGAGNGAEAIDRFNEGLRPCAIVLDLNLPLIDGGRFLKMRRIEPELARIPVLVITGAEKAIGDFPGLNVVAVFRKPFDPLLVVDAIRAFRGPS